MYSLNAFYLLLLALNAPFQIGKCTPGPRGTCTSGWEPLFQTKDPRTQATQKLINNACCHKIHNLLFAIMGVWRDNAPPGFPTLQQKMLLY